MLQDHSRTLPTGLNMSFTVRNIPSGVIGLAAFQQMVPAGILRHSLCGREGS
jgi:hypothetical protein